MEPNSVSWVSGSLFNEFNLISKLPPSPNQPNQIQHNRFRYCNNHNPEQLPSTIPNFGYRQGFSQY
jgi:hypothetical protein